MQNPIACGTCGLNLRPAFCCASCACAVPWLQAASGSGLTIGGSAEAGAAATSAKLAVTTAEANSLRMVILLSGSLTDRPRRGSDEWKTGLDSTPLPRAEPLRRNRQVQPPLQVNATPNKQGRKRLPSQTQSGGQVRMKLNSQSPRTRSGSIARSFLSRRTSLDGGAALIRSPRNPARLTYRRQRDRPQCPRVRARRTFFRHPGQILTREQLLSQQGRCPRR